MKWIKHITTPMLAAALLCGIQSCNDDDENRLSEAVLASASTLSFEATGNSERLITVYADADWTAEVPEWMTVSPMSGTCTTDVTISVQDNMREGAEDRPRKANIVFKGRTLASEAKVLVSQNGNKYRDVKDYTPGDIAALANDEPVRIPDAIVVAVTTQGFIVADEQQSSNVYVLNSTVVNVGDKVTLLGIKSTDTQSFAIVESDQVQVISTGGTIIYPDPEDITDKVDDFSSDTRKYISVTGALNGSNITVEGSQYSVNVVDAPESLGLAALNGHKVTVKGYFAGVAAPVVRIIATEFQDMGLLKTIYFSEDFEWLDPWAEAGDNKGKPAGDSVGENNIDAYCPQLPTPKVDGISVLEALETKGYEFLRVTTKTEGECIYLQRNYIKFGKTSYQAGIILPAIENIPSEAKPIMAFDWCPMRQGSGVIDPVNLIVIVTNGTTEVEFEVPESGWEEGHKLEWIHAEVELSGVTITKDTKITLRQTQWPAATANRWFLDNIEVYSTDL